MLEPCKRPVRSNKLMNRFLFIFLVVAAHLRADVSFEPPPGKAVGGLQATLRAKTGSCAFGERITLILEIKNVSREPQSLVPIGSVDFASPTTASAGMGSEGLVGAALLSGSERLKEGRFTGNRWPSRTGTVLKPGQSLKREIVVPPENLSPLTRGTYRMELVYFTSRKKLIANASEDLVSNSVRVTVR